VSVFDFTDSTRPVEIAYFDRGPIDPKALITGGYWSAYWYNGNIYGAEIARGLDVFRLRPSEHLSQAEIDAAAQVRLAEFNAQHQPKVDWPANSVTARAHLDQLTRSNAIKPERASVVKAHLDRADKQKGREKGVLPKYEALATALEEDAAAVSGTDAERLRALASILKAGTATAQ
jgi:hypothetical protein